MPFSFINSRKTSYKRAVKHIWLHSTPYFGFGDRPPFLPPYPYTQGNLRLIEVPGKGALFDRVLVQISSFLGGLGCDNFKMRHFWLLRLLASLQ